MTEGSFNVTGDKPIQRSICSSPTEVSVEKLGVTQKKRLQLLIFLFVLTSPRQLSMKSSVPFSFCIIVSQSSFLFPALF